MTYNILIQNEKIFAKDVSRIEKKNFDAIFLKIEKLKILGIRGAQAKRLQNYKIADFRIRVGSYRILFNFSLEKKQIVLLRILHRSKLY